MTKRYPDSVATLIQASKLSDSMQAEHLEKDQRLQHAQEELSQTKQGKVGVDYESINTEF